MHAPRIEQPITGMSPNITYGFTTEDLELLKERLVEVVSSSQQPGGAAQATSCST
jgi:hypothetical protein